MLDPYESKERQEMEPRSVAFDLAGSRKGRAVNNGTYAALRSTMTDNHESILLDVETWKEFLALREKMVETLGMICPLIEIALHCNYQKKEYFLRSAAILAAHSQTVLKKFLVLLEFLEETRKQRRLGIQPELTKELVDIARMLSQSPHKESSNLLRPVNL